MQIIEDPTILDTLFVAIITTINFNPDRNNDILLDFYINSPLSLMVKDCFKNNLFVADSNTDSIIHNKQIRKNIEI